MSEVLLQALRGLGRKRAKIAEVRTAYWNAHPELRTEAGSDARLLSALRDLERLQVIELPSQGSWERYGNPRMPLFVKVLAQESRVASRDWAAVPWVPEMDFWVDLRPLQLPIAHTINAFLLRRRNALGAVPIKERSLEIFGDEKALDRMRKADTLFGGRLPLKVLGAEVVSLPLAFEVSGAPDKPLLVVENYSSYYSFCRWNAAMHKFSAVAYGHGNAFLSSGRFLAGLCEKVQGTQVLYLGDLDPKGCQIPLDFNQLEDVEVKVTPAEKYYTWLLDSGARTPIEPYVGPDLASPWLGERLGSKAMELWAGGQRVPQEAMGYEVLQAARNVGSVAAAPQA